MNSTSFYVQILSSIVPGIILCFSFERNLYEENPQFSYSTLRIASSCPAEYPLLTLWYIVDSSVINSQYKMAKGNILRLIGLAGFVFLLTFNSQVECQKKKSEVKYYTFQIIKQIVNFFFIFSGNQHQSSSLTDRYQQIMDLSSKRTVIRLNGNKYRELVRSSPRNYSVVVMFTALSPKRQCTICRWVKYLLRFIRQ